MQPGCLRVPTAFRAAYFFVVRGLTCRVEMTSRTPSVSIASNIALLMSSVELTNPDKVTTPAVVLTEMLTAESSRLANILPLIAAVVRASAVASATAVPASRARRRTTWPGARKFFLDVVGSEIQHLELLLNHVSRRARRILESAPNRFGLRLAFFAGPHPQRGGAQDHANKQCQEVLSRG